MKSTFCWALILFSVLNFVLIAEDHVRGIAASTITERLFDYSGTEESPKYLSRSANVLLLGSSLILCPEWSVDSTLPLTEPWAKATIKSASRYHLAQGLTNELAEKGYDSPFVYNLAAGGALMSDSYLLLHHYLKKFLKPAVIVLDCAPRSFNDTGVTQPMRHQFLTLAFNCRIFQNCITSI